MNKSTEQKPLEVCEDCKLEGTQECEMCEKRVCRICGCTWNNACPGGCYWVEKDLCSECVGEVNIMAKYTEQEEKELNQQLVRWQKRQLTAVKQNNVDRAFEQMNDIDRAVWKKIANAETHKDVNYIVWEMAEKVISKYCKLAH